LVDDFDLLIGCTAVTEGMMLVTENVKDFKNIKDIRIENWVADHAE
jgi:tRNA(fMet)-specific endonuclease VapC